MWSVVHVFLFDTANGGVKRLTKRHDGSPRRNGSEQRVCRLSTSFVQLYDRPRQVSYGCECTRMPPDQRSKGGQIETRPTANVLPRSTRTSLSFPFPHRLLAAAPRIFQATREPAVSRLENSRIFSTSSSIAASVSRSFLIDRSERSTNNDVRVSALIRDRVLGYRSDGRGVAQGWETTDRRTHESRRFQRRRGRSIPAPSASRPSVHRLANASSSLVGP